MRHATPAHQRRGAGPAVLNQSKELWAGLKAYLLEHTATYDQRLPVFITGIPAN